MENKNFNTRGNGQLKDVESNEVYLGSKKVGAEIIDITKKLKDLECSRGYYDIGSKELFDIFQSKFHGISFDESHRKQRYECHSTKQQCIGTICK